MNTASHYSLDQRANVFVLNGAFAAMVDVGEAAAIRTKGHGLVLQIALTSLVTHGAIQGVVDEQELHHTLAEARQ